MYFTTVIFSAFYESSFKVYILQSTKLMHWVHLLGLPKNRRDNDGTGRRIPPTAGGHIVAPMTRRGRRRDSNYCQLMKAYLSGR